MKRALLIGTIMILLAPQAGWGQIPQTMSFQGVVTDAGGVAVDDNVDLTFKLWDAAAGGTQLWTETQSGVAVNNGIFNVILGSVNPLSIPFDKQYWLGVTVSTDPELTPRVQLTSSPYSLGTQLSGAGNSLDAADGDPADALFVDNAGNVGIGTTSPVQKLDIRGDTVHGQIKGISDAGLIIDAGGVNTEASMFYYRDGLNRVKTYLTSGNSFRIFVNLADRMTITPNGFLGIGTTNPAYNLDVSGDINFTGSLFQNGTPFGGGSSVWSLNGLSAFYNAGNVGIGTTSPEMKLHVSGGSIGLDNSKSIFWKTSFGVMSNVLFMDATNKTHIRGVGGGFEIDDSGGNAQMMVLNNGNVGIGNVTPTTKLDVAGTVTATAFVGDGSSLTNLPGGGGDPSYGSSATSPNDAVFVNDGGSVGIGTLAPVRRLEAIDHIRAQGFQNVYTELGKVPWYGSSASDGDAIYGTPSLHLASPGEVSVLVGAGALFRVLSGSPGAATERFRVTSTGNVGIGTFAPSERLEVVGTVKATAFVGDGSSLTNLPGGGGDLSYGSSAASPIDAVFVDDAGSVGIGTKILSGGKLTVLGGINTTEAFRIGGGRVLNRSGLTLQIGQDWGGPVVIPNGNVGIGTPDPVRRLVAKDHIRAQGFINNYTELGKVPWYGSTAAAGGDAIYGTPNLHLAGAGEISLLYGTNLKILSGSPGAATERFRVTSTGNVGIGTPSPVYPFQVTRSNVVQPGVALFEDNGVIAGDPNTYLWVKNTTGNQLWGFKAASNGDWSLHQSGVNDRIYVRKTGEVGIGTINPSFRLHVNGNVAGVGGYINISDQRYKKNIRTVSGALSKILSLRGVNFDWRQDEFSDLNFSDGNQIGFVAQEIKEILPEVVSMDDKGFYLVAYSSIVPVLVEALKEQQKEIEKQRTAIDALVARFAAFEQKNQQMTAVLSSKVVTKSDR